jgi:hypothetical protein
VSEDVHFHIFDFQDWSCKIRAMYLPREGITNKLRWTLRLNSRLFTIYVSQASDFRRI